jgi:hypothetical protein
MKNSILLAIIVLVVLGLLFREQIIGIFTTSTPLAEELTPFQKKFAGLTLNFRANLDEAEKVPVYPNETTLRDVILNNNVEEIGIAFIPNETENSYYLAASYDLAYKITVVNKYYFNTVKSIDSIPVNSSLEALFLATSKRPIIMLVGPSKTDSTIVNVAGYFITAQGKSFEEESEKSYNDLDLAVGKILLVLMKEISI